MNGMKALGIPNNKDFYEVTKIEDALALWKNIQVGACSAGSTAGSCRHWSSFCWLHRTQRQLSEQRCCSAHTPSESSRDHGPLIW